MNPLQVFTLSFMLMGAGQGDQEAANLVQDVASKSQASNYTYSSDSVDHMKEWYVKKGIALKNTIKENEVQEAYAKQQKRAQNNLSVHDKGEKVTNLQKKLITLGYLDGEAYGVYSDFTADAVKQFQKDHDIKSTDGIADDKTIQQLSQKVKDHKKKIRERQAEQEQQEEQVHTRTFNNDSSDQGNASNQRSSSSDQSTKSKSSSAKSHRHVSGGSVTSIAQQLIGVPYQYGGTTPNGFDCSGFIQYVFSKAGVSVPRTSGGQYSAGSSVSSPSAGDLVFFSTDGSGGVSHAGISLGGNRFIHASSSRGVTISSLNGSYWDSRYLGAKSY
ncbi:C40 family peptidase [Tuberibacillus sp. Marseille-P3662]|uniref:C40 family peptidase n=1 Tax=Tuberibacillus sp. Marseille-P3662 TaxID=1965358 RepID=UPI000A1CC06E|nr:NlpC/P60 family protein [Tuberibacillus sp. Marseille-P3662]